MWVLDEIWKCDERKMDPYELTITDCLPKLRINERFICSKTCLMDKFRIGVKEI
jgi:hypothetical protein